jgi:hypothetical protein
MGFINGVKTVFSDLKKYINQIDCPDEENVITDPELLESLKSIEQREEAFKKSFTSNKGGKGNSGKQQVVKPVDIDPKAVNAMAKEAQEKQQPVVEKGGEER